MINRSFDEYFEQLKGKRVAVAGLGISNRPLIDLLQNCGAKLTVCDKQAEDSFPQELIEHLKACGTELRMGSDYLNGLDQEVIFRSPGIMPSVTGLASAACRGSKITSEMEAFFEVCPCPIIGVTGSDGKTTTTTLIYNMLIESGITAHLGGNIGQPLLDRVPDMNKADIAVVELSSFQLMTMDRSPLISVVTNLTPNHLDKHRDMSEYIDAKKNIFLHQPPNGRVVLNYDSGITASFMPELQGRGLAFSRTQQLKRGVYIDQGTIIMRDGPEKDRVLNVSDILLPGNHNIENMMAAIGAVYGIAKKEAIRKVASTFGGVEHRMEHVVKKDGITWYNSSIDSSPVRTAAALSCFDMKVIVIAGGADKGIPLEPLGPLFVNKAKSVVLIGATADRIEQSIKDAEGYNPQELIIKRAASMEEAVLGARSLAAPGDIVVLSPGCTSYDMFKNFEERGAAYKEAINRL